MISLISILITYLYNGSYQANISSEGSSRPQKFTCGNHTGTAKIGWLQEQAQLKYPIKNKKSKGGK
jgi:hypothetical protein